MTDSQTKDPRDRWYRGGLRFECTGCAGCCSGAAGYVWVTVAEAKKLAAALCVSLDEFGSRYLRRVGERYALLDAPDRRDCIFLESKRCTVYNMRPSQCRSYPFWHENLESADAWAQAAQRCEGIDESAPLVDVSTIDSLKKDSPSG